LVEKGGTGKLQVIVHDNRSCKQVIEVWIPAFAGMTDKGLDNHSQAGTGTVHGARKSDKRICLLRLGRAPPDKRWFWEACSCLTHPLNSPMLKATLKAGNSNDLEVRISSPKAILHGIHRLTH
jgi:hypothetical protein